MERARPSTTSKRAAIIGLVTLAFATPSAAFDLVRIPDSGLPDQGRTYGGTWADVDGDGYWDLVLSRHGRHLEIVRGLPGLRFEGPMDFESPGGLIDHHGTAACDFDADGDWDLFLTTGAHRGAGGSHKHLWEATQPAHFVERVRPDHLMADPSGRGRGALFLRTDESPLPQLLLLNFRSAPRLFAPSDDGWADAGTRMPAGDSTYVASAEVADLDADGRADLIVGGDDLRVWHNVNGRFERVAKPWATEFGAVWDIASGDLDGDDDEDLLVALRGGALAVMRNTTRADSIHFGERISYPSLPLVADPVSVDLADLDNDGTLDLVVAQRAARPTGPLVARGRGDGTFDTAIALDPTKSLATAAWSIDLDRDGDLDLVFVNGKDPKRSRGEAVALYENRTPQNGFTIDLDGTSYGVPHGLGATVTSVDGARSAKRRVRAVSNPWNSTIPSVHFGVGTRRGPYRVVVQWPFGESQTTEIPGPGAWKIRFGADEPIRVGPIPQRN